MPHVTRLGTTRGADPDSDPGVADSGRIMREHHRPRLG